MHSHHRDIGGIRALTPPAGEERSVKLDIDHEIIGNIYSTTWPEYRDPSEASCGLTIKRGELLFHADEYRLSYCARFAKDGSDKYATVASTLPRRVVFLAGSLALLPVIGARVVRVLWRGCLSHAGADDDRESATKAA
jgi:hypothetical protein